MMLTSLSQPRTKPRLAFLGIGWIGRKRMEAIHTEGIAEICAICDPQIDVGDIRTALPGVVAAETLQQLMDLAPDGLVIATPSALHAEQSIRALDNGIAVFCQKPLGRNKSEVAAVLDAARRNDRCVGVDLSYRYTAAMQQIRDLIRDKTIGHVYAVDLVFHNAYGPDKSWFYDRAQSGGGCVMDLGVHLVDLLLWTLDFPEVRTVSADLFAKGRRMVPGQVEDYAAVTLRLANGAVARLTCSWRLHAGCDAAIGATFYGSDGALVFANVNGSFYDFTAELHRGTSRTVLSHPPDAWGGRAALQWTRRLASDRSHDTKAERIEDVADILDRIYADAAGCSG